MKELVRCKPCGYIMEAGKYDTCPACGVSSKVFEPYKDRVSRKRRQLLNLDLHPIAVHFPQTIAVFILQFMMINIAFPSFKTTQIEIFITFLGILLPLSVFGAFISGIFDAKIRFKKLTPKALRLKIILGVGMLVSSSFVPFLFFYFENSTAIKVAILINSMITLLLAVFLGLIGKKLMYAEMPG